MDLKTFRLKYNLSREDLASKIGISGQTVYRWETKMPKRPNRVIKEKLEKIMKDYNEQLD